MGILFALEQVRVRGRMGRGLRLKTVAGLGIALAGCALAAGSLGVGTLTSMAVTTSASSAQSNSGGVACQLTTATVTVSPGSGTVTPPGTVTIEDGVTNPVALGSQTLNSSGQASFTFALANGSHSLIAVYGGSGSFIGSDSVSQAVSISSQCSAPYAVTVSSLQPSSTLTAGETGTAIVTVTPLPSYVEGLGSTPGFITLSCSALPELSSCVFSPAEVEIVPGQFEAVTSNFSLQTQAAGTARTRPPAGSRRRNGPMVWALLLPGLLGIGGLGWRMRGSFWTGRLMLLAFLALITVLGTTGCNPLYRYHNDPPPVNNPTPAGTYKIFVTAQSTNGVSANQNSTTMTFTVQ
jgi:hypothetical protein